MDRTMDRAREGSREIDGPGSIVLGLWSKVEVAVATVANPEHPEYPEAQQVQSLSLLGESPHESPRPPARRMPRAQTLPNAVEKQPYITHDPARVGCAGGLRTRATRSPVVHCPQQQRSMSLTMIKQLALVLSVVSLLVCLVAAETVDRQLEADKADLARLGEIYKAFEAYAGRELREQPSDPDQTRNSTCARTHSLCTYISPLLTALFWCV